jgi:hypothetical protein
MCARPHEPGATFSDGKLCIFSESEVMVIRGWPEPSAVRKSHDDSRWTPFMPGYRLVRPYRPRRRSTGKRRSGVSGQGSLFPDSELSKPRRKLTPVQQRARAFDGFRFSLPKDVARILEPIRYGQWAMLQFLTLSWRAKELAESNPTLAYCVAARVRNLTLSEPHQIDEVVGTISQKRRVILEWLRLPATEATVRVLGKIHPASLAPSLVDSLRGGLAEPEVLKKIGHLSSVNMGVMSLVADPRLRVHASSRLLADVASDKRERHYSFTAELLERTLDMQEIVAADRRVPRFRSTEDIRRFHDEITVLWSRADRESTTTYRFPKPPVPGTPEIVPLRTAAELVEEGEHQHNCVGSYGRYVERGTTYIYRVLKPTRATLSIVRGSDGQWQRGELLAAGNESVGARTERAVDRWLASHAI